MKNVTLLLTVLILSAFSVKQPATAQDERDALVSRFEDTKASLLKAVDGLSENQMKFKPAPDRWSVGECLEHIIKSEKAIFEMEQNGVKQPANPDRRKEIKAKDEELVQMMGDRSKKGKAAEMMQPKGAYTNSAAAVQAFTEQRDKIIDYVKNTNDDLRNHVIDMPHGAPLDAYQVLLLAAGHSGRHTKQIEEVKADPAFPKE